MIGFGKCVCALALFAAGVAHGADPAFDFAAVSARRFPPPTPLAEATIATNFSRRFTFPHSTVL